MAGVWLPEMPQQGSGEGWAVGGGGVEAGVQALEGGQAGTQLLHQDGGGRPLAQAGAVVQLAGQGALHQAILPAGACGLQHGVRP